MNMERFWPGCLLGKWVCPRRLEIKCVRQDEPGCLVQRTRRNQVANPAASLIGDPFIDVLRGSGRIVDEIEKLKRRTEILFHQRQKRLAKVVSFLRKEPVGDA